MDFVVTNVLLYIIFEFIIVLCIQLFIIFILFKPYAFTNFLVLSFILLSCILMTYMFCTHILLLTELDVLDKKKELNYLLLWFLIPQTKTNHLVLLCTLPIIGAFLVQIIVINCFVYPKHSLLVAIWSIVVFLLGYAVLARVIDRRTCVLFSFIMYFVTYFFHLIWDNCSPTGSSYSVDTSELVDRVKKIADFLETTDYLFRRKLVREFLLVTVGTIFMENPCISSSVFLIFVYIDRYYHEENKLAKLLYKRKIGRGYTWWDTFDEDPWMF